MPKPNTNIPHLTNSAGELDPYGQCFLELVAAAPAMPQYYLESQFKQDMAANPHNEPYHNKRPRRSEAEIRIDWSIDYALLVLRRMRERRELDWSL